MEKKYPTIVILCAKERKQEVYKFAANFDEHTAFCVKNIHACHTHSVQTEYMDPFARLQGLQLVLFSMEMRYDDTIEYVKERNIAVHSCDTLAQLEQVIHDLCF